MANSSGSSVRLVMRAAATWPIVSPVPVMSTRILLSAISKQKLSCGSEILPPPVATRGALFGLPGFGVGVLVVPLPPVGVGVGEGCWVWAGLQNSFWYRFFISAIWSGVNSSGSRVRPWPGDITLGILYTPS